MSNQAGQLNLQDLNEQQINELLSQGITLEQIATEQGQPISPLLQSMMAQQTQTLAVTIGFIFSIELAEQQTQMAHTMVM